MLGEGCSQLAVPWAPAPEFGVCVTSMPSSRGFQEFGITSLACPPLAVCGVLDFCDQGRV